MFFLKFKSYQPPDPNRDALFLKMNWNGNLLYFFQLVEWELLIGVLFACQRVVDHQYQNHNHHHNNNVAIQRIPKLSGKPSSTILIKCHCSRREIQNLLMSSILNLILLRYVCHWWCEGNNRKPLEMRQVVLQVNHWIISHLVDHTFCWIILFVVVTTGRFTVKVTGGPRAYFSLNFMLLLW